MMRIHTRRIFHILILSAAAMILMIGGTALAAESDRYDPEYAIRMEQCQMSSEEVYNTFGPGADGISAGDCDSALDASTGVTKKSPYTGATYDHGSKLNDAKLLHGIDVSKWQGTVDWKKVKADGITFAFIRIGHSWSDTGLSNKDEYFEKNYSGATSAGIKLGVYYFSQAITKAEAVREAETTIKWMAKRGLDLPIMFDYESKSGFRNYKLTKSEGTAIATAFCDTIRKAGYKSGVYANHNYFEDKLSPTKLESNNTIWLARYNTYAYPEDYSGYKPKYSIWQYSGGDVSGAPRGKVSGVSGYCDLNFWYYKGENLSSYKSSTSTETPDDSDDTSGETIETETVVELEPTHVATPALGSVSNQSSCIRLTWKAVSGATTYRVMRKTGSSDWTKLGDTTSLRYDDKKVEAGGSYCYTVLCVNTSGDAISDYDATGLTICRLDPITSEMLSLSAEGCTITIRWQAVTGADSYKVYRKTASASYQLLAEIKEGLSYRDETSDYGIVYTYAVCAVSGKSSGAYEGRSIACVGAMPEGSVEAANSASGVKITWKKLGGAAGYRVYRKTADGEKICIASVSGGSTLSYTDPEAESGVLYEYSVCGYCETNQGKAAAVSILCLGTVYSKDVSAKNTLNGIELTWQSVAGAEGYRIYRKVKKGSYTLVGTTTAQDELVYEDQTISGGQTYYYAVRAYSGETLGYYSARTILALKPITGDDLTLTSASGGIKLTWKKVSGASRYRVYRLNEDGTFVKIGDTKSRSFIDKKAVNGQKYTYAVRPFNGSTFGAYECVDGVYVSAVSLKSVTAAGNGAASILLKNVNAQALGYEVQICTGKKFAADVITQQINGPEEIRLTVDGLTAGKKYYVRVRVLLQVDGTLHYSAWSSAKSFKAL